MTRSADPETPQALIIVTGLSGAGKSSVLNALEDSGYHSIDNLPLPLVEPVLDKRSATYVAGDLAIGLDIRTRAFTHGDFMALVSALRARDDLSIRILMVDAGDDVLIRRFSETRRPHPLGQNASLEEAIKAERAALAPIAEIAEVIDTSTLKLGELRPLVKSRFRRADDDVLMITCQSFGYAQGVPRDADLVFDVRFLRNPHYEAHLKPLTGLTSDVADYVRADAGFAPFFDKLTDLLAFLLPRYVSEGKVYLTLAFGCTGGKHRSVMMAEAIARHLRGGEYRIRVVHRDKPAEA